MSIGLMTVNAFLVLRLNDHGLSISAFSQYRTEPCLPSNDVDIPLSNTCVNISQHTECILFNDKNGDKTHIVIFIPLLCLIISTTTITAIAATTTWHYYYS